MTRQSAAHDLITGLIARTNQLGITRQDLADALGVSICTVNGWYRGAWLPSFARAVAWAQHIGLRLAVVLDGRVCSEGAAIPGDLMQLRRSRGLLQKDVAARGRTRREVIYTRERNRREPGLAMVHDHVTLLGYQLTLLRARQTEAVGV
ncbi:helix-turn-helix domain-containing protein [Microbispora rosea]|uniref:helix-turn-helix domain-containing protein n=1 Tax=Microbispora rosea TaxID=58117 RepID=UPI0037B8C275